jgi:hypothetical protein
MPPIAIRRCGYCRLEGHNISNCSKYDIDICLNILGRTNEYYHTNLRRTIRVSKISFARLAQLKMMIEGLVPHIIWTNMTVYPNPSKYVIRFENNILTYTLEEPNRENERITRHAILSNIETSKRYEQDFRNRYQHFQQGCRYSNYMNIDNLVIILTGDYIALTQRIGDEQRAQEAIYRQWARERENRNVQNNALVNRERFPIIRETAIETVNCPICLETLTETSNVVLRCGHQLCLPCLLTQTLMGNQMQNTNRWKCSICRTRYL